MDEFNLKGFRPEPDDPRHWDFDDLRAKMMPQAAGDVDLRPYSSPRHNQRSTSSCVANATVKALEIKRILKHGHEAHLDLSRLAVYFLARELMFPKETHIDGGTFISHAFDAIRRFGVCPETDWPFDETKIFTAPPWSAMRKAYVHKIKAFYKIREKGNDRVDAVALALQAGNPVVYGTNVDGTWTGYQKGQVLHPVSKADRIGRHATVIVGMQDGKFIGENSWGNHWGDDGFYLMDPAVIADEGASDFWVPQVGFEELKDA